MDEINEQTENMKQIQEALATPIGAAADFDEVSFIPPLVFSGHSF
jgi:charged multivesicular body protein 4A/B